jgi:hypothetical protein
MDPRDFRGRNDRSGFDYRVFIPWFHLIFVLSNQLYINATLLGSRWI